MKEKEAAVERWHEAEQEIDRLQHQLQVCNINSDWSKVSPYTFVKSVMIGPFYGISLNVC